MESDPQDELARLYGGQPSDDIDYVLLCEPLRLKAWAVRMPLYPRHREIRPFAGWDAERPTQSLPWYQAYNGTKPIGTRLSHATSST